MARLPIPQQSQMVDENGNVTMDWLLWFQRIQLSNMTDVSTTAPTNGQVLAWDATAKLWKPVAN